MLRNALLRFFSAVVLHRGEDHEEDRAASRVHILWLQATTRY